MTKILQQLRELGFTEGQLRIIKENGYAYGLPNKKNETHRDLIRWASSVLDYAKFR